MQVAILLAVARVFALLATTVLALSRLDKCIFTIAKQRDNGYKSFLAMTLMLHAVKLQTACDDTARSIHGMPGQKSTAVDIAAAPGGAGASGARKWRLAGRNIGRVPERVADSQQP